MKLTKYGHSCVLVEIDNKVVLFDPGVWSDRSLIDAVEKIDYVVYTHQHPDHFDTSILKSLVDRLPAFTVVCNSEIKEIITETGIKVTMVEEDSLVVKFVSPHGDLPVPGAVAPTENGYHFAGLFTAPGDSHSFNETQDVLAMAFIAPWGKTGDAVDKIIELKPKYVLPVHDWHYTDEAKVWLQGLLEVSFEGTGIKLLQNENGQTIKI